MSNNKLDFRKSSSFDSSSKDQKQDVEYSSFEIYIVRDRNQRLPIKMSAFDTRVFVTSAEKEFFEPTLNVNVVSRLQRRERLALERCKHSKTTSNDPEVPN